MTKCAKIKITIKIFYGLFSQYNLIINKAKSRVIETYTETHHIIPKCLGGSNDDSNLVELTAREHLICHRLLVKMYPNNISIHRAYNAMGTRCGFSSKLFEESRKFISSHQTGTKLSKEIREKMSKTRKGVPKTEETKAKMSKPKTEETKRKMSLAQKGNTKGCKNKGTFFWINNGIVGKRISSNEEVPIGWERGHRNLHIKNYE